MTLINFALRQNGLRSFGILKNLMRVSAVMVSHGDVLLMQFTLVFMKFKIIYMNECNNIAFFLIIREIQLIRPSSSHWRKFVILVFQRILTVAKQL